MSNRLPDGAQLTFIQTTSSGTVHMLATTPERNADAPTVSIGAGLAAWAAGTRPVIVFCGRPTHPVLTPQWKFITKFADGDLCRACYRTLHPDDRWLAFEHPQPAPVTAA